MSQLSASKRHQQDDQARSDVPLSTQVLRMGKNHIVSFDGTSQFTAYGVSSCGLAAFNFARIGFRIEKSKKNLSDILNELSTREVIEEIVAICAGWSSNLHLEVEDIHNLPMFSRSLELTSIEYCRPRPNHLQVLLQKMKTIRESTVMIITRPPEIIACFKFVRASASPCSDTLDDPLFIVFDSHPRPSHPRGAGLSFSTSIESTAYTLADIVTMDESIFNSSDLQWQAQLLANCSAHMYIAKHQLEDYKEAVIQSGLEILILRAQISEIRRENEALDSENKQLVLKVDRLMTSVMEEQMRAKQMTSSWTTFTNQILRRSFGLISHAIAGPSGTSDTSSSGVKKSETNNQSSDTRFRTPAAQRPRPVCPSPAVGASGARSIFAENPPPVPSISPPVYDDLDPEDNPGADPDDLWIQTVQVALKLQNQFDSEDQRLRQEHEELTRHIQATFQCGICMDELPEEDVAKVDECVHTMCRTCLREFVSSKIQEHRYPIFCPMCIIAAEGKAQPGVISRFLIEQLGVSEKQSQILTEMELAEFTVQIHCRKCRRAALVDREDYSEAASVVCPQRDCQHVWCKKCEQAIVANGPKHSCDGSNELDYLMKEKGWKHCPKCTTPIQKEAGCNHMMCISPGCNTHFCYICGGMIVRSTLNHDIDQAVSAHFRKCQLFEVPN